MVLALPPCASLICSSSSSVPISTSLPSSPRTSRSRSWSSFTTRSSAARSSSSSPSESIISSGWTRTSIASGMISSSSARSSRRRSWVASCRWEVSIAAAACGGRSASGSMAGLLDGPEPVASAASTLWPHPPPNTGPPWACLSSRSFPSGEGGGGAAGWNHSPARALPWSLVLAAMELGPGGSHVPLSIMAPPTAVSLGGPWASAGEAPATSGCKFAAKLLARWWSLGVVSTTCSPPACASSTSGRLSSCSSSGLEEASLSRSSSSSTGDPSW
mmetsp:Transcript_13343/g.37784  ORF Transcript_13343/g.37784 Transcript_13343/m.37784 type:complete len:274 (-) Transcript_13343:1196-2017(-)